MQSAIGIGGKSRTDHGKGLLGAAFREGDLGSGETGAVRIRSAVERLPGRPKRLGILAAAQQQFGQKRGGVRIARGKGQDLAGALLGQLGLVSLPEGEGKPEVSGRQIWGEAQGKLVFLDGLVFAAGIAERFGKDQVGLHGIGIDGGGSGERIERQGAANASKPRLTWSAGDIAGGLEVRAGGRAVNLRADGWFTGHRGEAFGGGGQQAVICDAEAVPGFRAAGVSASGFKIGIIGEEEIPPGGVGARQTQRRQGPPGVEPGGLLQAWERGGGLSHPGQRQTFEQMRRRERSIKLERPVQRGDCARVIAGQMEGDAEVTPRPGVTRRGGDGTPPGFRLGPIIGAGLPRKQGGQNQSAYQ